jgi:hypothetical protein
MFRFLPLSSSHSSHPLPPLLPRRRRARRSLWSPFRRAASNVAALSAVSGALPLSNEQDAISLVPSLADLLADALDRACIDPMTDARTP